MSNTVRKLVKALAGKIDGAQAIGKMIVLTPVLPIARGFLFEGRSTKESYYLWRLVVPMFSPTMPHLSLNYSDRLRCQGSEITIQVDEVGEKEMQAIADQLIAQLPGLQAMPSISAYLATFEPRGMDWRPNVKLELAFAKLLTGEQGNGHRMLDELLQLPADSPLVPEVQEQARRIAEASRQGQAALEQLAAEIAEQNLSALFPGLRQ